jgi:prepilin-type N-terminal cleavage/methylation domain-containing protein
MRSGFSAGETDMKRRPRKSTVRAFTLIELMLVIAVMAILAAATGAALAQAMEQGRVSRTQAQIARIHGLLMTRYDSYRTRTIRMNVPANTSAQVRATLRLNALREIMRLEMPERCHDIADFTYDPNAPDNPPVINGPAPIMSGITRPALSNSYYRKVGSNVPFFTGRNRINESSECLYLILSTIENGDSNGLDFLLPTEIGDTDNDGVPEILDAWGSPIYFLRWAPGLLSPLHNPDNRDAFDTLGIDTVRSDGFRTFNLTPLVFSAGPDRVAGIVISKYEQDAGTNELTDHPHDFSSTMQNAYGTANDPFCIPRVTNPVSPPDPVVNPLPDKPRFGSVINPEERADNIMNHFMSQK